MEIKKSKAKVINKYYSSKLKNFIDFSIKLWKINGYFYMPSSLAFYFIISLVPIISILFMLLSYFSKNSAEALISFLELFNIGNNSSVQNMINYLESISAGDYIALITSIVGSLYVASRAIECFSRFADRFYGRETLNHHLIKRKIRSMGLTLLFTVLSSAVCINLMVLSPLYEKIFSYGIGKVIQYFSGLIVMFFVILFFYWIAPTKKDKIRNLIPGALFSSIGISLILFFYGFYVSYAFGHLSQIYGPLTSLIIMLFVSLFSSYVFVTGFYLCILLKERKEKKTLEKEKEEKIQKEQEKKKPEIIIIDSQASNTPK